MSKPSVKQMKRDTLSLTIDNLVEKLEGWAENDPEIEAFLAKTVKGESPS